MAVDFVKSSVKWQSALVYLEDVAVFWKTVKQHLNQYRRVFTVLRDAGEVLKLKKSLFLAGIINCLDQAIHPDKRKVAESTTNGIRQLRDTTTQKQIRSFLRICNGFRKFVPTYCV